VTGVIFNLINMLRTCSGSGLTIAERETQSVQMCAGSITIRRTINIYLLYTVFTGIYILVTYTQSFVLALTVLSNLNTNFS
jgi:hypothetical protein